MTRFRLLPAGLHRRPHVQLHRHPVPAGSGGSDLLSGIGFGLAFGSSIVFGWFAGVVCDRAAAAPRDPRRASPLFLAGLSCLWWAHTGASAQDRVAWVLMAALWRPGLVVCRPGAADHAGADWRPRQTAPSHHRIQPAGTGGLWPGPLLMGAVRSRAGWVPSGAGCSGFALSSLLLLGCAPARHPTQRQTVLADMAEGFRAVAGPLLAQLMLAAVLAYATTGPMQILLPKLAARRAGLNELQRGAYLGLLALSLIVGGVTAAGAGAACTTAWRFQRHRAGCLRLRR